MLYTMDVGGSGGTLVGETDTWNLNAMATNSLGEIYVARNESPPNEGLFKLDPLTGQATRVADIGPFSYMNSIRAMAFSPADVLYVSNMEGPAMLYTVDVATGAIDKIGTGSIRDIQGMDFSPSGVLYGYSLDEGLITIDPATGASTDVNSSVGATISAQTIAFAPDGKLYAASGSLYELSVDTGQATYIGAGLGVRGMDFVSTSVPEPSSLAALLGIASIGLLGCAWRRRRSGRRSPAPSPS